MRTRLLFTRLWRTEMICNTPRKRKGNALQRVFPLFIFIMNIKRYLLHLFYPARCPVCNKIINYNDDFCTECKAKITPYTDFHEIENCDCAYSVCCYDENIQPAVFLLKDGICGNSAYAFALGLNKLLTEKILSASLILSFQFQCLKQTNAKEDIISLSLSVRSFLSSAA